MQMKGYEEMALNKGDGFYSCSSPISTAVSKLLGHKSKNSSLLQKIWKLTLSPSKASSSFALLTLVTK